MRILLVEDDSSVSGFIVKGLREEQYAVDLATDGEMGLAMAETTHYDVIILDIMLPKMNGIDVCRRLRAKRHATPILLLTAREAIEDRVTGLDTGADDYLTKPFAFAELLARLRALLRRGSGLPTPRLTIADLELDPVTHRVSRAGQTIILTNKEYSLLEYLMRNVGRVLTRTAITEHVWDIHYESITNIVDVHIKTLRSKMDRDFSPQLIHTVRGIGYVLKIPDA
ncbi:response regulator transcription factor [Candidatus Nitrospira allomarina]|uniref:Response regulator transcription factor n=1 Tax=Candidatus Nitrospira allomarina TaxID=3020900 RepID=A0AA96GGY1_9BACT|nr:response regulator transcription factor [Candidatus Nitrospira allomarina]WNM59945.1 response regulator transcription factor [Candidatus Nitrospira allomarina]